MIMFAVIFGVSVGFIAAFFVIACWALFHAAEEIDPQPEQPMIDFEPVTLGQVANLLVEFDTLIAHDAGLEAHRGQVAENARWN